MKVSKGVVGIERQRRRIGPVGGAGEVFSLTDSILGAVSERLTPGKANSL